MYVIVTIAESKTSKELIHVYGPFRSKHASWRAVRSMKDRDEEYYPDAGPVRFSIRKIIDIPEEDIEL